MSNIFCLRKRDLAILYLSKMTTSTKWHKPVEHSPLRSLGDPELAQRRKQRDRWRAESCLLRQGWGQSQPSRAPLLLLREGRWTTENLRWATRHVPPHRAWVFPLVAGSIPFSACCQLFASEAGACVSRGAADPVPRPLWCDHVTYFLELFAGWPLLCGCCRWNDALIRLCRLPARKSMGGEGLIKALSKLRLGITAKGRLSWVILVSKLQPLLCK